MKGMRSEFESIFNEFMNLGAPPRPKSDDGRESFLTCTTQRSYSVVVITRDFEDKL